jgi:hypothetical protein
MRNERNETTLIASIIKELIENTLWVSSVDLEHVYELVSAQQYLVGDVVFYQLDWCNASVASKQDITVEARIMLVGKAIVVTPVVDYDHFDIATTQSLERAANKLLNDRVLDAIAGESLT